MKRLLPSSPCLGLLAALGCDAGAWSPSPVGPIESQEEETSAISLANDLVETGPDFVPDRRPALAASADGAPRVVWLNYYDGASTPPPGACMGKPKKFSCTFGSSVEDCQRQVQALLDKWYADFNVVFTFKKPMLAEGTYYDSVISSAGGGYCGQDSGVAGVAPLTCTDAVLDMDGNTPTFYVFLCGTAHDCAVVIAQEHAHLVGLMHTSAPNDIMNPTLCKTCDGFEDKDNKVDGGMCRSTQNSFQLMKTRLGAWPGGPKEGPFGGGGGGAAGGGGGAGGGAGGAAGAGGSAGSGGGAAGAGGGAGGAGGGGGGPGGADGGSQGGSSGHGGSGSMNVGAGCAAGGHAVPSFAAVVVLAGVAALGRRRRRRG